MDAFLNNLLHSFSPTTNENNENDDMPPLEPISTAAQDVIMDEENDLPALQSVSESSGSESDDDANEVLMQAVNDDNDSSWTDDSAMSIPLLEPITRANRRVRVDDDEDEERDRRHPSQRISNPIDGTNVDATAHIPVNPLSDDRNDAPPPTNPAGPANGPRPPPILGGFQITIDINGQRSIRPLPNRLFDANLPGFQEFIGFLSTLSEPETEDPERAKQLVNALEEVPIGLIRRLEALSGTAQDGEGEGLVAGDCSCAICWDKLLDGEGGFGGDEVAGDAQEDTSAAEASAAEAPTTQVHAEATPAETISAEVPTAPSSDTPVADPPVANVSMVSSSDPTQPKIVSLPCAHIFHAACLIPWFSRPRQSTCPTCRFNIDPERLTARRRIVPRPQAPVPPMAFATPASATQGGQQTGNTDVPQAPENRDTTDNATQPTEASTAPASLDGEGVEATPNTAPPPAPTGAPHPPHGAFLTIGFDIVIGPPHFDPGPPASENDNPQNAGNNQNQDWVPMDNGMDGFDDGMMELDGEGDMEFGEFLAGLPPRPAENAQPNTGGGNGEAEERQRPQQQRQQQPVMPPWANDMMSLFDQAAGPAPTAGVQGQAQPPPLVDAGGQGQFQMPPAPGPAGQPQAPPIDNGLLQGFLTALFASMAQQQMERARNQAQNNAANAGQPPTQAQENPAATQPQDAPAPENPRTPPVGTPPPFAFGFPITTGIRPLPQTQPFINFANLFAGGPLNPNAPGNPNAPANSTNATLNANAPPGAIPGLSIPTSAPTNAPLGIPPTNTNAGPVPAAAGPRPNPLNFDAFRGLFGAIPAGLGPIPPNATNVPQGQGQGQGQGPPPTIPLFSRLPPQFHGPFYGAPRAPREKKAWTLPPAPGPTLRQRVERREREAGLRCYDVSCGVGPSDEEPFSTLTEAAKRQLNIRAPKNHEHEKEDHDYHEHNEEGETGNVCPHTFHPACLVSAARVALMGEEASVVDGDVEVACSVCRGVGNVAKGDWDEGVEALG